MILEVFSNLNNSIILRFYDKLLGSAKFSKPTHTHESSNQVFITKDLQVRNHTLKFQKQFRGDGIIWRKRSFLFLSKYPVIS